MKENKTKADLEELLLKGPTKPEARRESDKELNEVLEQLERIARIFPYPTKKWWQFWK